MKKIFLSLIITVSLVGQSAKANVCDLLKEQSGSIANEIQGQTVSLPVVGNVNIGGLLQKAGINLSSVLDKGITRFCPQIASKVSNELESRQSQICSLIKSKVLPNAQAELANDPQFSEIAPLIAPLLDKFVDNQCPNIVKEISSQLS